MGESMRAISHLLIGKGLELWGGLAVLFCLASPSLAQTVPSQPQPACQVAVPAKTAIYYVNGVTTTLDEARLNGGKLELEFLGKLPSLSQSLKSKCYEFFLNYNPTSGEVKDFTEAGQQALGLNPADMWRQLEGAAAFSVSLVSVLQGPMTDANQIDQPAIQRHGQAYRNKLVQSSNSCRVLVVPHSQGNLYTNAAYDVAVAAPAPPAGALKIVSVASPATVVKGGGVHRNSSGDLLIKAIDLLPFISTLPANTSWTNPLTSFVSLYSGGHSYIGYLSHEPSRTDILNDIEASLTVLESVACP
jgi:hypothetical protein